MGSEVLDFLRSNWLSLVMYFVAAITVALLACVGDLVANDTLKPRQKFSIYITLGLIWPAVGLVLAIHCADAITNSRSFREEVLRSGCCPFCGTDVEKELKDDVAIT